MILFINACVRNASRTKRLAEYLLARLDGEIEELCLKEIDFPIVDEAFLKRRDFLISRQEYGQEMFDIARQFASADTIVIAAPFWDLSFPAMLKQYLEQITVNGITFRYSEEGIPQGLCRAEKLYYVTTAGGPIVSAEYGYGYIKSLAQSFFGISETVLIKAEGLDITGANVDVILEEAMYKIL